MNGIRAADFALDMGHSFRKIIDWDEAALQSLAARGGLTALQLEELASWTGRNVGGVQMAFRGEVFVSRALRNPIIKGCPVCLREDVEIDCVRPLTQMTMRGDWQMREIDLCVRHCHQLVPLWQQNNPTNRYDLSAHFNNILPDILKGTLEQSPVTPSPYDHWVMTRLETGSDDTWLADHTLYAATTFCTLLGTELLRLETVSETDSIASHRQARALGFQAASQGEAAIRNALNQLASLANGGNKEASSAFGNLYADLRRAHLNKDDFATFRKIVRDCIVDTWPVAAGETVLGFSQPERLLHSILSASKETGIGQPLLEQILIHFGAIAADDDRPATRKTFDAVANAELLAEIPTLVGPKGMREAMGATRAQFASLRRDVVLVPRINIPGIISPWRASDGIALVAELQAMAVPIMQSDSHWEEIQEAQNRAAISVGTIIAELRAGKLHLAQRTGVKGYAAFCVLKEEIDRMSSQKQEAAGGPVITAAAFGRLVGIRTQGWFESLSAADHTPATRMPHPKWGGERVYASASDISEFRSRFVTLKILEEEFGLHQRTLLVKLKAAKVNPFAPNGEDFGLLYLREDAEAALK